MAVILGMAAIVAWAVMTARLSYVVTHGVSMNPVYYQGGLVFTVRADSYEVGQIVAYHGSSPGQRVLHRIIGGHGDTGFVLKGDNSQSVDPLKPTADELIGRAVLHIPKVGTWLEPLLGPSGLGVIGFLVVSGGAATARTRREIPRGRRKKRAKAMAPQGGSWAMAAAVLKAVGRLSTPLRVAAGGIAVAACSALVLGVLGWMKPVTYLEDAESGLSQSMAFSYTASVPRSAAYDGTTVTSPDPIFRKLTNQVKLGLSFRGYPGTFEVAARLTNGTGWHTTIPLSNSKRITGENHTTTVTLNLNDLDERAIAAAEAIGVPPAPVAISITARVSAPGRNPFVAALQLNLTSLQLSLVNGASSLLVKDSAAEQPAKIRVVREIKPFGYSIMTAGQARSYAVLSALCALVGAVVLALIARRLVPLRTRTEIERRYSHLLVPVEPMASPPGKPVVNVDNFPALVRLSERYGQMILTWRRPDADDFVVRDEGITYRYRVPLEEPTLQNIEHINRPNSSGTHRRKASSQVS
ncbi:hypothetical protein Ari01nite_15170 [Paractinoplanes rishiriensis]|uniref:Signal peptidase I n=2 Tax=Paractinoplanes rishiriensis TaxID=1050105 RepID=A0A919JV92_9ACTN|nr:hypothetical protein Ari01nite_15170 [Actinoplanes rishiriensis]